MIIIGKPRKFYSKAVFFDLDETLLVNKNYSNNHDKLAWHIGARETLLQLNNLDLNIIIVTNQSSINKNLFATNSVVAGLERFYHKTNNENMRIDEIFVCPHINEDMCPCRKPKPGLINEALKRNEILPENAFLFGDQIRDIIAGKSAGINSNLVSPGHIFNAVKKVIL